MVSGSFAAPERIAEVCQGGSEEPAAQLREAWEEYEVWRPSHLLIGTPAKKEHALGTAEVRGAGPVPFALPSHRAVERDDKGRYWLSGGPHPEGNGPRFSQ